MTTTSLTSNTTELREISGLPTETALRRAASFLTRLTRDRAFLGSRILPLLQETGDEAGAWYVAHRDEAVDGAYALKVFV